MINIRVIKGGEGSGHHDHAGRPGKVGGSAPSSVSTLSPYKHSYSQASAKGFADSLQANLTVEYSSFVTQYTPDEYKEMGAKCYVAASGQSGYAVKPDGDIVSVFSRKGSGEGKHALISAIFNGGRKLDCFDGYLPTFYTQFGFQEYDRWSWDDQYSPPGWNKEKYDSPDVVLMKLGGVYTVKSKKGELTQLEKDQRKYVDDVYGGPLTPQEQAEVEKLVKKIIKKVRVIKGGTGSGHHGHAGRPGKVGGSQPSSGLSTSNIPAASSNPRDYPHQVIPGRAMSWDDAYSYSRKLTKHSKRGWLNPPTDHQMDKVAEWMTYHEERVIKQLGGVIWPKNFDDYKYEYMRTGWTGHAIETSGFFTEYRQIVLRSKVADVFHHEVGHMAWKVSSSRSQWIRRYNASNNFDRFTNYAHKNAQEGFCETYMAYINTGGEAKRHDIMYAYDIVNKVLDGVK